jgi:hypothetical protein
MLWYDPLIIFFALLGILIMAFSSHEKRNMMYWGLILLLGALIVKAFLWFESLI